MEMTNIGVLVSGGGTNLQALIDRIADGTLDKCRITVVISSMRRAYALERARLAGIPGLCLRRRDFTTPGEFDSELAGALRQHAVDLVVTAGYTTVFGQSVIEAYPNKIINIHPTLIPSFCGMGYYGLTPHEKVLEYGVKLTGATTHFIWPEADGGPIIMQKAVEVRGGDTPEALQLRVMTEAEQVILPETVRLFSEGRIRVDGRITTILPPPED